MDSEKWLPKNGSPSRPNKSVGDFGVSVGVPQGVRLCLELCFAPKGGSSVIRPCATSGHVILLEGGHRTCLGKG